MSARRRGRRVAGRGRDPLHDRVEHGLHAVTGLRRDAKHVAGIDADELGELGRGGVRIGLREVDLVHDRHDLEVVLDREVGVRERLRLDSLGGVDEQHGALASRRATATPRR